MVILGVCGLMMLRLAVSVRSAILSNTRQFATCPSEHFRIITLQFAAQRLQNENSPLDPFQVMTRDAIDIASVCSGGLARRMNR